MFCTIKVNSIYETNFCQTNFDKVFRPYFVKQNTLDNHFPKTKLYFPDNFL